MPHAYSSIPACIGRLLLPPTLPILPLQGREKDVVIFCSVRCNSGGRLGFVADARRLNVAVTRARHALVLVGSRRTLAADELWAQWACNTSCRDLRLES